MCNPMRGPKKQLVLSILLKNQHELKHIDDWVSLINNNLPKPRRVTKHTVVQMFRVIGSKDGVKIEKEYRYRSPCYTICLDDSKSS